MNQRFELNTASLLSALPPLLQPLLAQPSSLQQWGIGGSALLVQLGLLEQARDLDVVCTEQVFVPLKAALLASCAPLAVSAHPRYRSRCFQRFRHPSGLVIELMAGIAVQQSDHQPVQHWKFDPAAVVWQDGLPWMTASQWLALYQLFARPARVRLLSEYLAADGC